MTKTTSRTDSLLALDHGYSRDDIARAAWTTLVEPGDSVAVHLIEDLGPVAALELALDGTEDYAVEVKGLRDRILPRASSAAVDMALRTASRFGATLLTPDNREWPTQLNDLGANRPIALWARGNVEILANSEPSKITALVGARAATGYGEHVTMELSAGLVDRGHVIVSGAAYGIDGMAHRAALASHGKTIALLAGGVDRFYPSGHDALLTRIVEEGLVLSELPCGAPPTKWRFLARNRIIAGLAARTIVIEAGFRSGSLNTASHAAALGRPLGAVPGPVTSAASAGCHRLLREYAAVAITNAEEAAAL